MSHTDNTPSRSKWDDDLLDAIYGRLKDVNKSSALMSSQNKFAAMDQGHRNKRCEFIVRDLKSGSQLNDKKKHTPRAGVFNEQKHILEEKHKTELSMMDDIQEFSRARAKLEMEHAVNMQRLAEHYHSKRKWPSFTYSKGHSNILLMDLWRSVINLAMEDAKAHAVASERLAFLAGDVFDKHRDRKKTVFRTTDRILEHLQDELFELDAQVAETKGRYDAAMKQYSKLNTAKSRRKKDIEVNLKKNESSCQFARQQYLLELAAANAHYLKFRNEQLPEVMDMAAAPVLSAGSRM